MPGPAPIRFLPLYQTRVWGGRRLETILGRDLPDAQPFGESWELCDRPEAQSVVAGGTLAGQTLHDLWSRHRAEIFGALHRDHPAERFPILLKILDCSDVLSLQVHPPQAVAARLGGEPKTEMWFVAHADPGAKIYAGLRRGATRAAFEAALADGTVADQVHSVAARAGEFMFVESGRLHALGAGLLVYEIQQNSDTTYRVFDWNRVGLDGKPRALHVEESLACIDFADFEPAMQSATADGSMASCDYFATRRGSLPAGGSAALQVPAGDFLCLAFVAGNGRLGNEAVRSGDFLLLPAGADATSVLGGPNGIEWLEISLPPAAR